MTTGNGSNECPEDTSVPEQKDEPADFEKAASAAGFGLFNYLLLFAAVPAAWCSIFDTATAAFILAAAECDLSLTTMRKGILVSMVYIGMMATSFLWELLTNRAGRRLPILYGLLADACCNIAISMLHSYYMIIVLKFVTGFLATGPLNILTTYLMEFHSDEQKPRFVRWSGILFGLGNILVPALAFYVLPQSWSFTLVKDQLVYKSWRIFLLICSFPPIVGLATIAALPESPMYLMRSGRCDEALKLFKKMYSLNTRESADSYPFALGILFASCCILDRKWLREKILLAFLDDRKFSWIKHIIKALLPVEKKRKSSSLGKRNLRKIQKEWMETKVLFSRPYNFIFTAVLFIQFSTMLGFNTLRLWLPQLFALLGNFVTDYPDRGMLTMCEILRFQVATLSRNQTTVANSTINCIATYVEPTVFLNSTIITTATVFGAVLAIFLSTNSTRRRTILLLALTAAAASSFGINWGNSVPSMLTMAAFIIATTRTACTTLSISNNKVIPNALRGTAGSHVTTIGHLGAISGNLLLPIFLEIGCLPALMFLGCILTASLAMSIFLEKRTSTPREAKAEVGCS